MVPSEDIAKLVAAPSLTALTYQAHTLVRQLAAINDQEYPIQACRVAAVLLAVATYVRDELWALYDPAHPLDRLDEGTEARVRRLAKIVYTLFQYVGHLCASVHLQSPPALQAMVAELAAQFFPAADNGTPISLVVPQWEYNLSYIGLGRLLRHIAKRHDLDPTARLPARTPEQLLQVLWTRWRDEQPPEACTRLREQGLGDTVPLQVAILSFASLDTDDALLYPLLAHELGHFIDFSFESPLHLRIVGGSANTTRDEIEILVKAANPHTPDREVDEVWLWVTQMVRSCVTELLADCLATRMLGVSFFAALAEFLKTIAPWSEPRLTKNGYPGITVRLAASLQQLRRGTEGALPSS